MKNTQGSKNHFLIEVDHLAEVKEIQFIELTSLGLDKNIICELSIQNSITTDILELEEFIIQMTNKEKSLFTQQFQFNKEIMKNIL